jgi:hypothetical protein
VGFVLKANNPLRQMLGGLFAFISTTYLKTKN